MSKKLRIMFVLPFAGMSGGVAVVLEYYRRLTDMGHNVNIVYPLLPYREQVYRESTKPVCKKIKLYCRTLLANIVRFKRSLSHFLENISIKPVIAISNCFVPDADIVIATAWPTAYDVNKLSPKKGRKFYLVQGYEIWYGYIKKVNNSYRLPFNIITIAPWLTELMKNKFGRNDNNVTEIHNGIRLDKFYPPDIKIFEKPLLLMMAHDLELKGTQDAIEALTIVKKHYPQLEIKMFGLCRCPEAPFDFEYHQNPSYEELLSLYQEATIFIFPSHGEGWGLTPIEAMACGCAVVATNVGCIPIINNGENMVIAEVKNPVSIANGVIRLLADTALAEKIANEGLKRIREQGWERAARMMLNAITG